MPTIKPDTMPNRDPKKDDLLQPENSVIAIIDFQSIQLLTEQTMNTHQLMDNTVALAKLAKIYDIPLVLSTVNVTSGKNQPTYPALMQEVGEDYTVIDRESINAWEDVNFNKAIKDTGRKNIIIAALWTEACLSFPTIDALGEGYNVFPMADCTGGTTQIAHDAALSRLVSKGAQLTSVPQLACELQRNYDNNAKTDDQFNQFLLEFGSFLQV